MSTKVQKVMTLEPEEILSFCGHRDANLRQLQKRMDVKIVARGNEIRLLGESEAVERAHQLLTELIDIQRQHAGVLTEQQVQSATSFYKDGRPGKMREILLDTVAKPVRGGDITPLTPTQKCYADAIRRSDVVFGIGPAGTGKSYLAVAMAVSALLSGDQSRIILVRPAVEAGERLGFLPGDIAQKFDPYVRPLYDALYEMLPAEKIQELIESGTIEIAPLAFMRGRTLNNSFVILDEAQNSSIEQMKMFLTRLGFDSKAVITGDVTQIDLPQGKPSGLIHANKILKKTEGIEFVHFTGRDVVRHPLVQRIVEAYEAYGQKRK